MMHASNDEMEIQHSVSYGRFLLMVLMLHGVMHYVLA